MKILTKIEKEELDKYPEDILWVFNKLNNSSDIPGSSKRRAMRILSRYKFVRMPNKEEKNKDNDNHANPEE